MSADPFAQATWVTDVIRFWFGELTPEQWFKKDATVDRAINDRYRAVHDAVSAASANVLLADSQTALASIVVLDQFSRNMFRGTARAFASDGKALGLATAAIGNGFDMATAVAPRQFFYMPFEHAEDRVLQGRSIELFAALGSEELMKYALAHQTIIERFGRFPHRNEILGRVSTAEELAFLQEPDSSF